MSRDIKDVMFKEIMILGISALGLLLVQFGFGENSLSEDDAHTFEAVHFTIFLVAAFYAFFVTILVVLSHGISRKWDKIEELDATHWKELKVTFDRLTAELGIDRGALSSEWFELANVQYLVRAPQRWARYRHVMEHVRYHELRHHFIRANHLPRNFDFGTCKCEFLCVCLAETLKM